MLRVRKKFASVGNLDDAAEIHDSDPACHVAHNGEVVADEQIGQAEAILQVAHEIQDLRLHRHVEGRGRLVADNELRIRRERARNRDALALAAGEFMRVLLAVRRMEADQGQQLADAIRDLLFPLDQPEGPDRLGHDTVHLPAGIEAGIGILEDHLDAPPQALALGQSSLARHGDAVDHHFAVRGRQQSHDHAGDRGLARAGLADERKGFPFGNGEGDSVDRFQILLLAAFQHPIEPGLGDVELTAQVFDFDIGTLGHATASDGAEDWS